MTPSELSKFFGVVPPEKTLLLYAPCMKRSFPELRDIMEAALKQSTASDVTLPDSSIRR